jgi:hypothetical protein
MTNLTTDTWDTLIEKSRNSSGLRCTLDGRRETTCLEEAIEKEPSVDEREYLKVVKHAVPKQINPFHLVGLLHEVTSRLGNDIFSPYLYIQNCTIQNNSMGNYDVTIKES